MNHDLLERVKLIQKTPELNTKFRRMYGTDYQMVEACIKEDLIKEEAVNFINNLTDDWLNQAPVYVDTMPSEGVAVYAVEYMISSDTKRDIMNALKTIRQNPYIENCQIDGSVIWRTVKQFGNTIDDPKRNEIPKGDTFEFRSDVQRLIIDKNGDVTLKAYSAWNDAFLTFEIE